MTLLPARSIEDVIALFEDPLLDGTYGEDLSIRAHMLQCAALAAGEGAPDTLVAAALLHDIGWALGEPHESSGADWLEPLFGPAVATPIRLHVLAKRYLVATRPDYAARLSEMSKSTLVRQGGALSLAASRTFARHKGFGDTIRLRQWDDDAKEVSAEPAFTTHHHSLLLRIVNR